MKEVMEQGVQTSQRSPLADAIKFSAIQQVIVLVFAVGILDGGDFFSMCMNGTIGFWCVIGFICLRRRKNPTNVDIAIIKWGYLVFVGLSVVFTQAIWAIRGIK
ncbi:MAG: hypothetical protein ACXWBP_03865 [Limisphaerales bacterium]